MDAGFSSSQADEFVGKYNVLAQYTHTETIEVIDEITGEVTGTVENSNGLSVKGIRGQGIRSIAFF